MRERERESICVYMYSCICVQYWFIPTMRQMERFETKTRSPVYSFFAETLGGTAVIRAFGHQQRFIREFERRVDLTFAVTFTWGCADK